MENTIDEVKNRIDIVQYIGQIVQLKKAGRNFKALCPFHDEKTPSFMISPDRQLWRCFGSCHEGGDIISFAMKLDNLTFYEALQELARYAGVKIEHLSYSDTEWNKKEILIKINALASKYFHYLLTEHKIGKKAREYLYERDINDKLIKTFQLGYSPTSWDSLLSFLRKKGYTPEDILKTGLIIKKNDTRYYDRFRDRLMFPLFDHRNILIGFSGRIIETKDWEAKYINTPETVLYHKRETLFGINIAKDSIRKENKAIVVEGEFDMISCFKHGITNCVAIKGSAFTKEQLILLKRYCLHLILALDADAAGTDSSKRALEESEQLGFRVDIANFTQGKDPDEALKENEIGFKKSLSDSIPIYDFIFNSIAKNKKLDNAYEKSDISDEFIQYVAMIENPIIQKHYIRLLANFIKSDENAIDYLLSKYQKQRNKKSSIKTLKIKPSDRYELMQKYLFAYLLQNNAPFNVYNIIAENLTYIDLSFPAYKNILTHLEAYYKNNKETAENFSINNFIKNLPTEIQNLCDELIMYDLSATGIEPNEKDIKRIVYEMKFLSLKRKIKEYLKDEKDSNKTKKLLEELKLVEKHLNKL